MTSDQMIVTDMNKPHMQALYRAITMKKMLQLEIKTGLRHSRGSTAQLVRGYLDTKTHRKTDLVTELGRRIQELRIKQLVQPLVDGLEATGGQGIAQAHINSQMGLYIPKFAVEWANQWLEYEGEVPDIQQDDIIQALSKLEDWLDERSPEGWTWGIIPGWGDWGVMWGDLS